MDDIFQRTELLVGSDGMGKLREAKVIVFGVGGVGSWCVEALARSGIGHLTIVDGDRVCASNINRQLMAATSTIGEMKVEAMKSRLLDINPLFRTNTASSSATVPSITAIGQTYTPETANRFILDNYDYVIDAIDSLHDKALLILNACHSRATLFSSMGAALKSDISHIRTGEFWQVKGCPLARALRNTFKREKTFPERKFMCVYSDQLLANLGTPPAAEPHANGTLVHATAAFGLTLSSLVVRDILKS